MHDDALQQAPPDQGLWFIRVHWLPAGPPHVFFPEHELAPHVSLELADCMSTLPEQQLDPQETVHESVALQAIAPPQDSLAQLIVQVLPPQLMPPEQELLPHSMSQLDAFVQSIGPLQPLSPHCTTHATPGGHATGSEHFPAQSMTQWPFASQVPLGQDCGEQLPLDVVPEEPQAAMTNNRLAIAMRIVHHEHIMIPDDKDELPNMPEEDAYASPTPEPTPPPPEEDPVDELKKGIGMLFRAAKHAVDQIPTEKIGDAVKEGVKEVERAVDNIPGKQIGGAVKMGVKGVEVAAKEAAKRIPTEKIGSAVKTGAKEVGKAIESVAEAVERTVNRKSTPPKE